MHDLGVVYNITVGVSGFVEYIRNSLGNCVMQCPSPRCDKLVPITEVMEHMDSNEDKHSITKLNQSTTSFSCKRINEIIESQGSTKIRSIVRIELDHHYFLHNKGHAHSCFSGGTDVHS